MLKRNTSSTRTRKLYSTAKLPQNIFSTYNGNKRYFSITRVKNSKQVVQHIEETKKTYKYPTYDIDEKITMEEDLGLNFSRNWSLAYVHIHPQGDCYGNLDHENLISRSFGQKDKRQCLLVDSKYNTSFDLLATPDPREHDLWPDSVEDLDPKYARRVGKDVTYYMSHVPHSFVRDSITSSSVSGEVSARIVSDNAVSDLFFLNMSLPKSKKSLTNRVQEKAEEILERNDEEEINRAIEESQAQHRKDQANFRFPWNVTLINAPGYRFELDRIIEEFGGPRPSDLGLTKPHFLFSDPVKRMVFMGGIFDNVIAMESLAYLTGRHAFQEHGQLLFPADVIFTNGAVTMIIGNDMKDTLKLRGEEGTSKLYSAHHSIWSTEGISRVWAGVSVETKSTDEFKLGEGNLIEEINGGNFRVSRKLSGVRPNVVKHPSNIIIAVESQEKSQFPDVSLLNTEMAIKTMITGLQKINGDGTPVYSAGFAHEWFNTIGSPGQMESALRGIFENSPDTRVYLVNKNGKNSKQIISDISSGKAPSLKPVSGVQGWKSVPGVDKKSISSLISNIEKTFVKTTSLE